MSTVGARVRVNGDLWLALAAVAASVVGTGLTWVGWVSLGQSDSSPVRIVALALTGCLAPGLLVAAVIRLLWRRGAMSGRMAVVAASLGGIALAAATMTALSFGRGIAEADGEAPQTLFADLVLVFFATAIVLGTVAVALVFGSVLGRTSLHRGLVTVSSIVIGLVGVVPIGVALMTGTTLLAIAFVAVLLVLQSRQAALVGGASRVGSTMLRSEPGTTGTSETAPSVSGVRATPAGRAVGRAPLVLALASSLLGLCAAAFALSGSVWPLGAGPEFDSTSAMGYGVAAGLVAAIPLVAALALTVARRRPRHPLWWSTWAPTGLICAALLMVAATSLQNALSGGSGTLLGWNLLAWGLALYAAGIALVVGMRVPLSGMGRVATSVLIGAGVAAATAFGTFALPFVAPLVAIALAFWVIPRLNGREVGSAGTEIAG
ncbi:hypothetical protein [Glaciibacter sp. 2TAF33]|uniref:hypothetical protein n=1 Tax=Glaciibacter sp. 2TAF33 TaxID=3233015 RepID=UPI003F8FAFE4